MYVYLQICVTWGKEQGEETKKEQDFKIDQSRSCRALGDFHSATTFSNRSLTVTIFLNPAEWLSSGHQSQPLLAGKIPSWTLGAKVLRFSKSQDVFFNFSWPFPPKNINKWWKNGWRVHHLVADLDTTPTSISEACQVQLISEVTRLGCLYSADNTVFTKLWILDHTKPCLQ